MEIIAVFYFVSIGFPLLVTVGVMWQAAKSRKRRRVERAANKRLFGLMDKNIQIMDRTIAMYETQE